MAALSASITTAVARLAARRSTGAPDPSTASGLFISVNLLSVDLFGGREIESHRLFEEGVPAGQKPRRDPVSLGGYLISTNVRVKRPSAVRRRA
jgi:hypothetical protein